MNSRSVRGSSDTRWYTAFNVDPVLLASALLFVSGLMQLTSTWMQWQSTRNLCVADPASGAVSYHGSPTGDASEAYSKSPQKIPLYDI